jgi:CRP-like cAMP-binding protein
LSKIAKVAEPGAVFGEISVLLDQPHAADVHALEISEFHVADATTLLTQNPIAVLYVATMLAHRLNGANHALIQLKHQLLTGEPPNVITKTVTKMEGLLIASVLCMQAIHTIRMLNQQASIPIGATKSIGQSLARKPDLASPRRKRLRGHRSSLRLRNG